MDLQTLADRIEINDLLTRYAHAVDSKDWALYRTVFTPDAFIDYESSGGVKGDVETVAKWLEETMAGFPMTQHLVSNVDVHLDGDAAHVRAMFYNPMGLPGGKTFFCGGWYNHDLVRTPDGWRSRRLYEEGAWFDRFEEAMGGGPASA
jgi:3-phenylpropionate/cinnamic acid dioxygenase small subunit